MPELGTLDVNHRDRSETLKYALWLRRCTNELAPTGSALTAVDLGYIASMARHGPRWGLLPGIREGAVAVRVARRALALAAVIWHNHKSGQPVMRSLSAGHSGRLKR
ncbi:hypothetical protein AB0M39_20670 [Streptomyces sp. NPDC051907]|uniref:hypothetical protein n=1 Tax=Streptomyces sp. NPDC051907 TaxID=3155284 RepID=UPI003429CCBC